MCVFFFFFFFFLCVCVGGGGGGGSPQSFYATVQWNCHCIKGNNLWPSHIGNGIKDSNTGSVLYLRK